MATASTVAVLSVSRSSNIVTVTTSTVHGLVANQGFQLLNVSDNSFNQNGTVLASPAPTTTTYAFSQVGTNGSSSGGQVLPAKEVIVLDVQLTTSNLLNVHYLLWLTTAVPFTKTGTKSVWGGASSQENAALVAGTTIEVEKVQPFPNTLSKAQIQAFLQADFQAEQAALAGATQPGAFFGGFMDSVGWSF
jgi:hypothetical protein